MDRHGRKGTEGDVSTTQHQSYGNDLSNTQRGLQKLRLPIERTLIHHSIMARHMQPRCQWAKCHRQSIRRLFLRKR